MKASSLCDKKCDMCVQALRAIAWHHEGKQFMCSHSDGSLTTWNAKMPHKAASVLMPHGECCFFLPMLFLRYLSFVCSKLCGERDGECWAAL